MLFLFGRSAEKYPKVWWVLKKYTPYFFLSFLYPKVCSTFKCIPCVTKPSVQYNTS